MTQNPAVNGPLQGGEGSRILVGVWGGGAASGLSGASFSPPRDGVILSCFGGSSSREKDLCCSQVRQKWRGAVGMGGEGGGREESSEVRMFVGSVSE